MPVRHPDADIPSFSLYETRASFFSFLSYSIHKLVQKRGMPIPRDQPTTMIYIYHQPLLIPVLV